MTQPSHTHKTKGGRFAMLAHYNGDTALDAQMIVVYRDLDREIETATTAKDWDRSLKQCRLLRQFATPVLYHHTHWSELKELDLPPFEKEA